MRYGNRKADILKTWGIRALANGWTLDQVKIQMKAIHKKNVAEILAWIEKSKIAQEAVGQ